MKKKHNEFCEGHVQCPNTGKEECGKVVVWKCVLVKLDDGTQEIMDEPATVVCFGCGKTHNVTEEPDGE